MSSPDAAPKAGFAQFFIHRPIFAIVLSLVTLLGGTLALTALPIAQYPDVVPPQVVVTAVYPGANAQTVAETVAIPIEEQINGVEGMLYMESQCTNDGALRLTVTFAVGTDPDMAQVLVQNRVGIATPKLPDVVKAIGVVTKKQSSAILMVVNVISPVDPKTGKPAKDDLEVSNYARLNVKDELARIRGVGDVFLFGEREYSVRVWLDPDKMADLNMAVNEVTDAIREQNAQVAAGQIGQSPAPKDQAFQLVVNTQGRLPSAEAFADIVVRTGKNEQLVRLKDVARVELGARSYDSIAKLDGRPSVGMPIFQLPGANAFETATLVRETMEELKAKFPEGIAYEIVFDPTEFVKASVEAVVHTLIEAIVLVAIVVLLFLQNWRAALIPMLAVPVALIGTAAAMYALGFSINNLTLFGMVLAIGIVVDDAIVVVEAVEFHMARGLSPVAATELALTEVSGAIIGTTLVLTVVFVPAAFIPGITGLFFKQFAVTIAVSTILSAVNSLTLSPAMCAVLLKPHAHGVRRDALPWAAVGLLAGLLGLVFLGGAIKGVLPAGVPVLLKDGLILLAFAVPGYFLGWPVNRLLGWLFGAFNWGFDKATIGYGWVVGRLIRVSVLVLLAYVGLLVLTGWAFARVPGGFIPQQDQGYLVVNCQLPDGASVARTEAVMDRVTKLALEVDGIDHVIGLSGFSIFAQANISNGGGAYITLAPFEGRHGRTADMILGELNGKLSQIEEGLVLGFGAPPILGLGNAGGFKMQVRDRNNLGLGVLEGQAWKLVASASREPGIVGGFSGFTAGAPQLYVDVDRERCQQMGIRVQSVNDALQVYLGSLYVNDVTLLQRNWQVNVQADAPYRARVEDLRRIKVRSPTREMVPISGLITVKSIDGPMKVNRFQMAPAADVNGFTIPSVISSGQAIEKMEALAKRDLPEGMDFAWTDMAYQQKAAAATKVAIPGVFAYTGDTTLLIFALSVVLAFMVLAAQYESWLLPLGVVLIVPMCLLCAALGVSFRGLDLNVFTQIGLVVLVGLACKNAILIVEYAKQKREAGQPRYEAAVDASKQRLRPILMTSFAFILGVLPLVTAEGAGAEMRTALGTAVFSGMLGVTFFGVLMTPVFYVVLQRLRDGGR